MKKAVIVMMVVLFSGNVFAGSACSKKVNAGLVSSTNPDVSSSSGSSSTKGTR
ncbi:MAG: hypothetical protein V4596_05260 [Bdellovibrionota bacterium]